MGLNPVEFIASPLASTRHPPPVCRYSLFVHQSTLHTVRILMMTCTYHSALITSTMQLISNSRLYSLLFRTWVPTLGSSKEGKVKYINHFIHYYYYDHTSLPYLTCLPTLLYFLSLPVGTSFYSYLFIIITDTASLLP